MSRCVLPNSQQILELSEIILSLQARDDGQGHSLGVYFRCNDLGSVIAESMIRTARLAL
jgi:hypothetical protein